MVLLSGRDDVLTIHISVRNLVEFVFRSGDIDNRIGAGVQTEAMLQGNRMHRKIQRSMGSGYRAEVALKHELDMGGYILSVEGRADGIFCRDAAADAGVFLSGEEAESATEPTWFIDEIKSMYTDVTRFETPQTVHLAQAKTYAYIYALQNDLTQIGVQVTYCNLDTEEIKRFEEILSFAELSGWFEDMIASYRRWTDYQYEWSGTRRDSIRALSFPFSYREGQKKLAADVYRTIAREKTLFLQAPTGTGKTIATVFPAVKAMGEELTDVIFYLTAKTVTRTVAKEAFDVLKDGGLRMKVVTITAKEKCCPLEEMDCNPEHCPYAKGHYDRVGDAVYELWTGEDDYTRDGLLAQAQKHAVCPFEMTLDLAQWSDAVICDYNYVFDPNVYLRRFFAEGEHGDYVFLVDEAHNLVERGRAMYSADLVKEEFLRVKKIFKKRAPDDSKIANALEKCNRQMLEWKRACEDDLVLDDIGNLPFSLMRLMSLLDEFLRRRTPFPERTDITEFYFSLRHFLNMYDRIDENYVLYADFDEAKHFVLHLYCVNPAQSIQECVDRGRSAVFFSATLLPIRYYKSLLSVRTDDYAVYAETSFTKDQRLLFVAQDVSSLYKRRNLEEYQMIADYIEEVALARRGNYIVYFPSYRFMEDVYVQFMRMAQWKAPDSIVQSANMTEAEREAFLAAFSKERKRSLVAFCVLGGIFAEGIDLVGEQLVGVLIVGTGLPQICSEREILKGYYNGELTVSGEDGGADPAVPGGGEGFAYAYQYPGMNKVMQAAGRVIRTAADVGVIGLLDERFLRRDYRELFPREWDDFTTCQIETLPAMLKTFWAEHDT